MLDSSERSLRIFERFVVDTKLSKFEDSEDGTVPQRGFGDSGDSVSGGFMNSQSSGLDVHGFTYDVKKPTFKQRVRFFLKGEMHVAELELKVDKTLTMPVEEFFRSVKNSVKEIKKIDKRADGYIEALKQAETMGQTALIEKLTAQLDVVKAEGQLFAMGLKKVVTEDQIVKFYKECEIGVRLDWVRNFTRIIPSEFLEIKKELDEKGVFDNYVIIHYDKKGDAYSMTQEEIKEEEEKKKDPILFGVIRGSRKLYYIGDWVDEFCDLTLEDFIDKYGKTAINKNNLTAKVNVDEIVK